MGRSLTTRLIVLLTLCSLAILAIGTLLDYRISRSEILDRVQLQSQDTIKGVLVDLENLLDGVEGSTSFLGRILEQREYSLPGLEQMLKDLVEQNGDIYGATIALNPQLPDAPEGFAPYYYHRQGILTRVDLAATELAYHRQAWYADTVAAGKPLWIEPYFDKYGAQVLMTTYAVPVYRVDNEGKRFLYAVVTADITLRELHNYLQRLSLGKHSSSILLSREGTVLSTGNAELIMHHYRDIVDDPSLAGTWQQMVELALSGQAVTRQLACPDSPGDCTVHFSALQSTGWPLAVMYSQQELLAPLRSYIYKTVLIALATLAVMALAVALVTRRLTRPLTALAAASDEVARGELNTPLPRVSGEDEVARLVRSFHGMTRDLKTYIDDLASETASRSRLEGEIAAARQIQMSMLPGGGNALQLGRNYTLWAGLRPAKLVGGDLYSYSEDQSKLCFAVGDVSDKGVPAALFMAKAISHLQQLSNHEAPAIVMAELNNALEAGNDNCMFVTLFFGVLDLPSGELRFCSAGHTPPSLVRQAAATTLSQETGPALGLAPGLVYPTNTLQLLPGDRLAICTDGIDEAFNERAEMYGVQRFEQQLTLTATHAPQQAGEAVFKSVEDFADGMAQSDDIALLLLDLAMPEETGSETRQANASFIQEDKWVTGTLSWLHQQLEQASIPPEIAGELILVTEEIVANIDRHANLQPSDHIQLATTIDAAEIRIEVSDPGRAFNPLAEARRASLGENTGAAAVGGLGVHLITRLSDKQSYHRTNGRNILRVSRSRKQRPG